MSDIMNELQMEGMSGEAQAMKALQAVLDRIHGDPYVGWYLGVGTQTFSLVTEAAATLFGEPVEKVRRNFAPRHARNPREEAA